MNSSRRAETPSMKIRRFGEGMRSRHEEVKIQKMCRPQTTWADVRPFLQKPHNAWREGIVGYGGHVPRWIADRDIGERRHELGKVHPPFQPIALRP
jgi:hypothetical protein